MSVQSDIKKLRKSLSWILLALAVLLFSPPGLFGGLDDIINLEIAKYLMSFTGLSFPVLIFLTYTLLPLILLLLAGVVSPTNTDTFIKRNIIKLKQLTITAYNRVKKNPLILVGSLVVFYLLFKFYFNYLKTLG